MNKILKYKLFENPDIITYKEPRSIYVNWQKDDAVAFGYRGDEMRVGLCKTHIQMLTDDEYEMFVDEDHVLDRDAAYKFLGRFWYEQQVISFWTYPQPSEMQQILDDIEEAFNKKYPLLKELDFSQPEWLIEVIDKDLTDPDDADWNEGYWCQGLNDKIKPFLVPLSNYRGSKKRSEEEMKIIHLMSWKEKQELKKKGWGKGWGSDMTAWDSKNPLAWRQAKYQESLETKFKNFINEEKINFKIYCDLDGVLTDFDGDVYRKFLKEFNKENDTDFKTGWEFEEVCGSKEFWSEIKALGLDFWSKMSWMPDGKELWNYIKEFEGTEILSKPSRDKLSGIGKKIWCKRKLGDIKVNLFFRKESYATPTTILIDDLEKNIKPWREKGGIGILHKNTKDTLNQLKKILGK